MGATLDLDAMPRSDILAMQPAALQQTCLLAGGDARIATSGGLLVTRGGEGGIAVDMGEPRLDWAQIPLAYAMDTLAMPVGWDDPQFLVSATEFSHDERCAFHRHQRIVVGENDEGRNVDGGDELVKSLNQTP